jgi:hypothetical protein
MASSSPLNGFWMKPVPGPRPAVRMNRVVGVAGHVQDPRFRRDLADAVDRLTTVEAEHDHVADYELNRRLACLEAEDRLRRLAAPAISYPRVANIFDTIERTAGSSSTSRIVSKFHKSPPGSKNPGFAAMLFPMSASAYWWRVSMLR